MDIAKTVVDALEEKKGEDIILLDIQDVAIFADYFVICSGTSERMLNALLDSVVDDLKPTLGFRPKVEGLPHDGWLLADYGDVILHLFSPPQRDYYQLEDLWSEAKIVLHVQ